MGLPQKTTPFIFFCRELFLSRSVYRTSVSAASAANALVSVDNVLAITLRDAAGGTSVSACTAADALIRNFVCHIRKPPFNVVTYILAHLLKKSRVFSKKTLKNDIY